MQIRCTSCTRTISLASDGALPTACPHCAGSCIPQQLGPFVPLRLVATGGMGEVYLARHCELGTEVALKLLPAMPLEQAATVRERFAREARLTARVRHEGVVKVLASDIAGDRPYLVLEFVDGQTLRELLRAGPLPIVRAARLAALTADVLAAAHRESVLHRDIKPDNVMVAKDGSMRVLDFGIARAMTDDAPLTRTGEILGTPEYMAPEQLLDGPEATDERTDVHALGVLLYELLTGRSPFHGANLFQALKLVESLVPAKPSSLQPQVPAALDAVVLQALQKRREERFATAREFAAAVRNAVPEAGRPQPAPAPRTRWWYWLPLAVVLLVGGYLVFVFDQLLDFMANTPPRSRLHGQPEVVHAADAPSAERARRLLDEGRWARAVEAAEQAIAGGDRAALAVAQDAFLLAHQVWPLAVGLPPWLGCCDERQRDRLFGSSSEPAPALGPLVNARLLLASGACQQALTVLQEQGAGSPTAEVRDRRLLLLAAHLVGADGATLRALALRLGLEGDPAARLVSLRLLPAAARATAFTEVAALAPIDEPEHWLALRCADACGDSVDLATAALNAKMAWLNGAGELAVMLDAALPALLRHGASPRPTATSPEAVLRRVGAAEPADTPASVALRALLLFAAGDPAAAEQALAELPASTPAALQPFQDWLVAARSGNGAEHATQRGLAQLRFGDVQSARWQFGVAKTPTANLCGWLLLLPAADTSLPADVPAAAFAAAAELVHGDTAQVGRLLAAAAAAPAAQRLAFLRLAVLAGAEVDFAVAPWNAYAEPPASEAFAEEVCGGLRR